MFQKELYVFDREQPVPIIIRNYEEKDFGLDIVATQTESLIALYMEYNEWILDYDRKKIDLTFALGR
ncbi:DUF3885 domain-containing protein [Paenibacillus antri]|uniref:DUF3885 domain-containing protein n=1 Tax=Paenibacillus antri TaxID=2582848 RepID=A0A5R9GER8_9BACL|nr:DUF3885 domain-containing protein [Paenibacillus antri]